MKEPTKQLSDIGDVTPETFREQLHHIADWIADYRQNIESLRVSPNAPPGSIRAALPVEAPETGESFEKIMADVDRVIIPGMTHWGHPMFLGYFGWTTTAPGILAEILSAPLNVNAMTWRTSPVATELETVVVDWLRRWLQLSDKFGGVVFDTASVGVVHALAVAREEAATSVRKMGIAGRTDIPRFCIYTSDQAHSSAEKAAIALGFGEDNVRRIPSDSEFRMDVAALDKAIRKDLRQNFRPLAVIATVGTTSTASVDPVAEIAKVCREHKVWLHVDGAYGAGFAILPEYKWITVGWEEADSIVANPHKTLFVPLDFSVLYVRDLERLRRVFTLVPEYLRGDTVAAEKNYMDYGIQLGRRFRALKAWIIWRSFGRQGIAARLQENVRLAELFASWVKADSRFELSAPVVMPVVCFRLRNSDDEANARIVETINASGKSYLTHTKLHGRTVMRLGLGNILTKEEHVRRIWDLVRAL